MAHDINPRDDEFDQQEYEENEEYRSNPSKHEFMSNCGQMEGEDRCWLCGRRSNSLGFEVDVDSPHTGSPRWNRELVIEEGFVTRIKKETR